MLTGNIHLNVICVIDRRRRRTGPSQTLSRHLPAYQDTNTNYLHEQSVPPQYYNTIIDAVSAMGHLHFHCLHGSIRFITTKSGQLYVGRWTIPPLTLVTNRHLLLMYRLGFSMSKVSCMLVLNFRKCETMTELGRRERETRVICPWVSGFKIACSLGSSNVRSLTP